MKKVVFTAFVLGLVNVAFGQSNAANNSVPETMSNVFFKALQEEDTGTMSKILANNFQITNADGQSADKDLIGQALSGGHLVVDAATTSDVQSRLVGANTGLVTGKVKFKGKLQNQAFDNTLVFTVISIQEGETWKVSDVRLISAK